MLARKKCLNEKKSLKGENFFTKNFFHFIVAFHKANQEG